MELEMSGTLPSQVGWVKRSEPIIQLIGYASACLCVSAPVCVLSHSTGRRRQASSNLREKCHIKWPENPAQYNEYSHTIKLPLKLGFAINCGTDPLLCLCSNASQLLE